MKEGPVTEASTMAAAGALLFGAGAALSLVALILPHHPGPDPVSDTITSLIALVCAGALWRYGRKARIWFFHAMVQTGNLLIAVGMFTGGPVRTTEHYAFLYLWGALYAFYFFSLRAALLHMAAGALGYAAVLLVKESDVLWISKWFVMMGSFTVSGLVVSRLTFRIRTLARNDSLTGLFNRRTFEEELARQVARAQPAAQLCVMLIDLDKFKSVNDTLGHQAGDRFLKEIAARWTEQLRNHDVLARYGGDEFAAILPRCPIDAAADVADRLRAALPDSHTCSIGVAKWDGIEGKDELLQRADEVLYRAKEAGRNRVAFTPDPPLSRDGHR
jgi:diguanylate cyclase (GGDEF)-like protein